jgi:3-oxoacyl-[acyl-carrier protein] reductase
LLKGKTALITGARTGIGKATVKLFAENGVNVIAHMRKQDDEFDEFAQELESSCGVKVKCIYFDLKDTEKLKKEIKALLLSKTQIDILVNNAGVIISRTFQMTTISNTREVFENNLFASMEITQLILRQMVKRKSGAIVNVASIAGIDFIKGNTTYGVSKAAVIAWTKALALETADYLVRVNAVAPGITDTKMSAQVVNKTTEQLRRVSYDNRYAKPEEIAETILFL